MLIYQVLFSPLGSFFFLNFPWRMILGRNAALRHHARRCFELRAGPLRGRVRASRVSISLEGGEAGCMTADLWTANKNVKLWWNHVKLVTLWVAFSYAFFFETFGVKSYHPFELQALEGTTDDSAFMEPNEHLAVFFGLHGRCQKGTVAKMISWCRTYRIPAK